MVTDFRILSEAEYAALSLDQKLRYLRAAVERGAEPAVNLVMKLDALAKDVAVLGYEPRQ
jgi:hypothetical protein